MCKYGGVKIIKKDLVNNFCLLGFGVVERKGLGLDFWELIVKLGLMWIWIWEDIVRIDERVDS